MNEKTNKKGFGAWFRDNWKNNALFSTGIALIVMVILQTLAANGSAHGSTTG